PRRTILLRTQTIAMCLAFSLAVLASNRVVRMEPWHIAVFAALGAVVNAFNMPAQQAFVTQMVDDPKASPNAIALSSLRFNLARVLGPLFAGIALVKLGAAWCFALNGASYIAVLWSLSQMRIAPNANAGRSGAAVSPWDGARFLVGIPALLRVTLLVATGALSVLAVSTLYPVLAGRFDSGASGFSTLVTVNGVGATLGGLFVVVFGGSVGLRPRIYGGATVFSIALLAASFASTFPVLLTCLFFAGAGMVTFMVSANTKIQTDAPDELRGRVMAMHALIVNALIPVGGLLLGFVASRFPVQSTIRFAAIVMLGAVAAIWLWSTSSRGGREKR
ncbi:MAG: MFS transporter, partial [Armatimonadetes bacterium]|nr:MFS transporter [Armatimonadota bacterium]